VNTKVYILCVDDYDDRLIGARLLDPATMTQVGASGCGAWNGYSQAVDAAFKDAVSKGHA
jgi:hypothetical protein